MRGNPIDSSEFKKLKKISFQRAPFSSFTGIDLNHGSELFYKGKEVALFYLRAGYDPSCYVTDPKSDEMDPQSWSNRLLIEKSRSIKSPPVNYHLLTNKRFQGMLRVESTAQKALKP